MFWNRSLDWLISNYSDEEQLFYVFGRNAYLKTRNLEGDRAFERIKSKRLSKVVAKVIFKSRANIRQAIKTLYLKFMCR